jgi:hypothetical protein
MALLDGSPAIAVGDPENTPAVDQRGVARGSPPSIGAFELTGDSGGPPHATLVRDLTAGPPG